SRRRHTRSYGDWSSDVCSSDLSTVAIASRTDDFGIDRDAWHDVGGGESGWIAPSPKDSNVVFAGSYGGYLTRYDHRTKQLRAVRSEERRVGKEGRARWSR